MVQAWCSTPAHTSNTFSFDRFYFWKKNNKKTLKRKAAPVLCILHSEFINKITLMLTYLNIYSFNFFFNVYAESTEVSSNCWFPPHPEPSVIFCISNTWQNIVQYKCTFNTWQNWCICHYAAVMFIVFSVCWDDLQGNTLQEIFCLTNKTSKTVVRMRNTNLNSTLMH